MKKRLVGITQLALTERPDVILMDLEMPVVDRWEPVRTLKKDPRTRSDAPLSGSVDRAAELWDQATGNSKPRWRRSVIEWFDDLAVGVRFKSPERVVTREEIKRFASEFDPQPYRLDEAAAEETPLKGLAASGWHTAAIAMRLAVEVRPFGPHPLLGLGVDELGWLAPVRPGDKLYLEGGVVDIAPSKAKLQGIARIKWTAFNQHGDPVYTFTPIAMVPRRST